MVDRTRERKALYRRNAPWRVYDAIVRKTCLHVDGWLYQMPDDQLYFVFIVLRGGTDPLSHSQYRVDGDSITPVAYSASIHREGLARHIDSKWAKRNAPQLNRLYWRDIYPTLTRPYEGFKGHRSIRLRFVYTDPTLDDPFAGLTNLYAVTGRRVRDDDQTLGDMSVRDAARIQAEYRAAFPAVQQAWTKAERSVLRTLDKLLK